MGAHCYSYTPGGIQISMQLRLQLWPYQLFPSSWSSCTAFVGNSYFCESGTTGSLKTSGIYPTDPVWDSQGCVSGSACCDRGGPWFTATLIGEVRGDIEVRVCHTNYDIYDIGLDQLEIFIY